MLSPWARPSQKIPELATIQEFDRLAEQDLTVVFKHSPTCPVSLYAHQEVVRFCSTTPEVPVYLVSVRRQRDVARHIADQTGVTHESPQVLVFRRGKVIAAASHDDITADGLALMLKADRPPSSR
jgi:bacillithiol system protein YtxJ